MFYLVALCALPSYLPSCPYITLFICLMSEFLEGWCWISLSLRTQGTKAQHRAAQGQHHFKPKAAQAILYEHSRSVKVPCAQGQPCSGPPLTCTD